MKIAKNGHQAKAKDFAKSSLWVKNEKCLRTCYKRFYNTLQLIYSKKGSKKQLIFERWEDFENSQKWPPSKGYRLCKIVSLGQKLKMPKKTYYKYFYNTLHLFYVRKGSKKRLISEK